MSHDQATVAEEEYLQIIYWLQEAGLPITGANIARAMQVSAPTVHEMIGRLEGDGYVTRAEDKSLSFTASGRDQAAQIVRRHRLIERFLTDVLGIPWDEVHEEAERLEHAMSPVLEAGVTPDFRGPDSIRLGVAPLYTRFVDVWDALDRLRGLVERGEQRLVSAEKPRIT